MRRRRPAATASGLTWEEPKRHGTNKLIEGPLPPGARVVLLDDTATTGGNLFQATEAAEAAGCRVVYTLVMFDRKEGAGPALGERGYPFRAACSVDDLDLVRHG